MSNMCIKKIKIKFFFHIMLAFIALCYLFIVLITNGAFLEKSFFVTERFNQWGDFFGPISWIKNYQNPIMAIGAC